ncbi:MAG: hypothetical protein UT18_C0034G0005 [candidate division CPR2 bacterium GW2011_GWC2_39_10]|uniref:Nudix hydrolase domain-containing protein n=1 Tax=candidate division CPR2 bacterium GW2011_GWC2_39_10 TaxID=1618345 RepID=A0A0G0LXX5_UNCC2|nr:MAG: hypothetical protein UT18_C0034G0005 [candidate division CPR2 bacterium GW2011_GWC2_39_10]
MLYQDVNGKKRFKPLGRKVSSDKRAYGIVFEDSKLLLVKPTYSQYFELPGGGLEGDEDISDALKYFLKRVVGKPFVKKVRFYIRNKDSYAISDYMFFRVEVEDTNRHDFNHGEIEEVKWVGLDELMNLRVKKIHLRMIRVLLS